MASKKYKLLLTALLFVSTGAFAQVGGSGSVYDSSVIPNKRMGQQNEFWQGNYNFPAKPRNMWEIGASIGLATVSGDVATKPFTFPNFDVHVRKAFGYIFSLRVQYLNTSMKGQNYLASENFLLNPAWNTNIPNVAQRYYAIDNIKTPGVYQYTDHDGHTSGNGANTVYYNYKTHLQDLGLQGIVTLNNIRFHKQKTGIVIYGGAGVGVSWFDARVNALDGNGNNYSALFNAVKSGLGTGTYKQRKDIRKALKDGYNGIPGMDNTYETEADNENYRRPLFGNNTVKPSGTVLAGVAIKLSKRINLAIEDRWTFVKTDLLDGQRWQEHGVGDPVLTSDFDSYNYASIGLNVNLGSKAVEPLWWLNPLDYAYDELKNHRNVKIPKADCPDADGDGVCDHLDREPNTPAGCPVDTHGVTKDTDGDGVPDCKDKQLITPTECQPVDADGVGHCPLPDCCKNPIVPPPTCPSSYPSLTMKSAGLSADNKATLATCAAKLKGSPTCSITITGHSTPDKRHQAACNKKTELIKNYLIEKEGISADRITVVCKLGEGDENVIDIESN